MICPTCRVPMIVVERHQIELDYCTKCEGVWFDSGELELLLRAANLESPEKVVGDILVRPEIKSYHKERKCPVCNRRMKETAIDEPPVHIDVCREGDGLWFDGGEIHQLLKQIAQKPSAKPGSQQQIVTFLGDVFQAKE